MHLFLPKARVFTQDQCYMPRDGWQPLQTCWESHTLWVGNRYWWRRPRAASQRAQGWWKAKGLGGRKMTKGTQRSLPEELGQRSSKRQRYSRWDVSSVYPVRAAEPSGRPPDSYSCDQRHGDQTGYHSPVQEASQQEHTQLTTHCTNPL